MHIGTDAEASQAMRLRIFIVIADQRRSEPVGFLR